MLTTGNITLEDGEYRCALEFPFSETDTSLIGSLFPIGALVSGQVSHLIRFGRKAKRGRGGGKIRGFKFFGMFHLAAFISFLT